MRSSELPIITVPELFSRASGPRVVTLVADTLTDELDPDDAHPDRAEVAMSELDHLLASREMILVAGSGGVGKTTIAAALGVAAAQRQKGKVLVLTVDPARRLATALGLDSFGNTPVRVPADAFADGAGRPERRAARRTVGGDARHEGRLGRADPPPRARRGHP